jgi:ferritin-like metal-binding protein YciE
VFKSEHAEAARWTASHRVANLRKQAQAARGGTLATRRDCRGAGFVLRQDPRESDQEEATMGLFSKDIHSLEDLYHHGLKDIYYAENQIVKSLPKMIENASDGELKRGLQQHLRETQEQVRRLQQVFKLHDQDPSGDKCPAIDGIIQEGDDLMGNVDDQDTLGAGLIAAAQAVEHYEITRYGALIAWAKELGHRQDATLLGRTLNEEKATDKKLTALAERRVNPRSQKGGTMGRSDAGRRTSSSTGRAAASRRKTTTKKTTAKKKASSRRA